MHLKIENTRIKIEFDTFKGEKIVMCRFIFYKINEYPNMSKYIKFFMQVNCFYISSIPMGFMNRFSRKKSLLIGVFNTFSCDWKDFHMYFFVSASSHHVCVHFLRTLFSKVGSKVPTHQKMMFTLLWNHMEWGGKGTHWYNGCKVNVPS